MNKIAKCPVCGQDPEVWCRDEEILIRIVCCKHAAYSTLGWNQYAAAMELATKVHLYHNKDGYLDEISDAEKRVVEVFGGE